LPSCLTSTCRVSDSGSARGYGGPYEGLSRMRGNSQVRFLGGRGRVTARAYPAHPEATLRLPSGYPQATLRLPGRSGAGWEEPGAGGPPSSGNSTNQSAKARAITTNSNSNPVHEIARHVTVRCRLPLGLRLLPGETPKTSSTTLATAPASKSSHRPSLLTPARTFRDSRIPL
jgi:hypothetical protein